jgi:hypothetical protein
MYVSAKMILETIPGIGRGRKKEELEENGRVGEFKYDIFDTL